MVSKGTYVTRTQIHGAGSDGVVSGFLMTFLATYRPIVGGIIRLGMIHLILLLDLSLSEFLCSCFPSDQIRVREHTQSCVCFIRSMYIPERSRHPQWPTAHGHGTDNRNPGRRSNAQNLNPHFLRKVWNYKIQRPALRAERDPKSVVDQFP